jgi:hypothetical protein
MTLITDAPVETKVEAPTAPAPLSAQEQDTIIKTAAEVETKAEVPADGAKSGDSRGWTTKPETSADRARAAAASATERASRIFLD